MRRHYRKANEDATIMPSSDANTDTATAVNRYNMSDWYHLKRELLLLSLQYLGVFVL
jgi:hypothetical protein